MTGRQLLHYKTDNLSESEIADVLNYIHTLEIVREQASRPDLFDDEIVSLLSDAVENRRARTVAEWEKIRRKADSRAAASFR